MARVKIALVALGACMLVEGSAAAGDRSRGMAGTQAIDATRVIFILERQRNDLGDLVLALSDPRSRSYGGYWSVEEIAATYGGSAEVVDRVVDYLAGFGASGAPDVTGSFVSALLTRAQVEAIFGPDPDYAPPVPAALGGAVTGIYAALHNEAAAALGLPWPRRADGAAFTALAPWPDWAKGSGTPAPCPALDPRNCDNGFPNPGPASDFRSFTPDQLRTAYGFERAGLAGRGGSAVVVEFSQVVLASDLAAYSAGLGLPHPTLAQVALDEPIENFAIGGEATEDVQTIVGLAPGLDRITLIAGPGRSDAEYLTYWPMVYSAALDAGNTGGALPDVISSSWDLGCEPELSPGPIVDVTEVILQTAAAAGVTVVVAAGDQGSSACAPRTPPYDDGFLAITYPASSPWVTAAGGTNLVLNDDNSIRRTEVWNDWPLQLDEDQPGCTTPPCRTDPVWAGTGGDSTLFARPPWQAGRGVDRRPMRQVPDVSFLADIYPATLTYQQGQWSGSGNGTSQAAPIFAAVTLALNEFRARLGHPPLGFANPLLYRLAAQRPSVFRDVIQGNNIIGDNEKQFDVDCCFAAPGYDRASGWGSLLVDRAAGAMVPLLKPIGGSHLPSQRSLR